MKFKLKQITSAVSVGCMALVLTACGNDTVSPTSSALVSSTKLNDVSAKLEQLQKQADQLAADKKAAEAKLKEEIDALQKALEEKKENLNAGTGTGTGTGTDKPSTTPAPAPEGNNDLVTEEIVKHNPLIGSFDAEKQQSFGATHYSNRGDLSKYDRELNPNSENRGSNSNPLTESLDKQNPNLTNFVLGSENITNTNLEIDAINYLGENTSPININTKFPNTNTAKNFTTISAEGEQNQWVYHLDAFKTTSKNSFDIIATPIQVENAKNVSLLNSAQLSDVVQNKFLYTLNKNSGLVTVEHTISPTGTLIEAGTDDDTSTAGEDWDRRTTSVFGKNFDGLNVDQTGRQNKSNSYQVRNNNKTIAPITLQNVQYGRLTANIDALAQKPTIALDGSTIGAEQTALVSRPFIDRKQNFNDNAEESFGVDTYFHRGTNATTLDQMKAIKAKNIDLKYQGHAITYGVGDMVAEKSQTSSLPNSFGQEDAVRTVGNFVQATYKVATDKVDGSIYNLLDKSLSDGKTNYAQQDLVSFSGEVKGNSIIGTAKNLTEVDSEGDHLEGTFFGTFYGKQAEELGGTITSIERDEKNFYGEGEWGAVFGAAQTNSVGSSNNFGSEYVPTTGKK